MALDPKLWEETVQWVSETKPESDSKLSQVGPNLGGGGAYPLLYFLVRKFAPTNVIETGVAAGWSSHAILIALEINQQGSLYSSDFPYFRLDDPERFVGLLVPNEIQGRWTLDLSGDRAALPRFLEEIKVVDLFHYDSDKSINGRSYAVNLIMPHMKQGSFLIMDDIQDNTYFKDLVESNGLTNWVFEFQGKFVGLIQI